jgi:hypothetical protein
MKHKPHRRPGKPRVSPSVLERINLNAAGIDCGSAEHFVSVPPDRDPSPVQSFPTFTADLVRLADWLTACGVTSVAIAYASHCTSLGRCETFSSAARLFDNLTPLAFSGGWGPGSSYRYSCLSLHR